MPSVKSPRIPNHSNSSSAEQGNLTDQKPLGSEWFIPENKKGDDSRIPAKEKMEWYLKSGFPTKFKILRRSAGERLRNH
jgi:hypothetical protein